MRYARKVAAFFCGLFSIACPANGAVIVDDTWADGSRNEQKPPVETAWFSSTSTNMVAGRASLTLFGSANSRQFLTYFAPTAKPIKLADVGDAVIATLNFSPSDVADENPSRNLRFGLFDSNGGKRLNADGTPNGVGVVGYALFMNFARTFGAANALQVNDRDHPANTDLLGASAAYTPLPSNGQPANHSNAFTNGGSYSVQFSVKRVSPNLVEIKTLITGGSLAITNTATDSANIFTSFDTFAIRTTSAAGTAGRLELTQFRVEGPKPNGR